LLVGEGRQQAVIIITPNCIDLNLNASFVLILVLQQGLLLWTVACLRPAAIQRRCSLTQ
jgi:hypothetical protein